MPLKTQPRTTNTNTNSSEIAVSKLERKKLEGYSGRKTRSLLSKENKIVNRLFGSVLYHSKVK